MRSLRVVMAFSPYVFAASVGGPPPAAAPPAALRPHIVYIVADDQGRKDVGFHGSDIKTPNLDELARGGARLDQFYAQPMYTPAETTSLADQQPRKVEELQQRIEALAREAAPPLILGEAFGAVKNVLFGAVLFPTDEEALTKQP